MVFVIFIQDRNNARELENYISLTEQQQVSHLEKLGEFTENYNELHDSYNELWLKYHNLAFEKGCIGDFICTGYSANDPEQGTNNITAIGVDLNRNWTNYFNLAAVDPEVIPLGSILEVRFKDGNIRYFLCVDTGGDIKGKRIDLYFTDKKDAIYFGKRRLEIRVLR